MKHIIQFVGSLNMGGAETLVKDYACEMIKDTKVTVVVISKSIPATANEKQLLDSGVEIINLSEFYPTSKYKIGKGVQLIKRCIWLKKYIIETKVDVIHLHLFLNKYLYIIKRGIRNVRLFHTVHNEPDICFNSNYTRRLEKYFTNKLIKDNNMRLIALHDNMRVELNQMFHVDNTVVVNNGINLERFDKKLYAQSRDELLAEIGLKKDDFIIGHVGRFAKPKNHKFLVDVFNELLKNKENAKLLLVGVGPLKEHVKEQIASYHIEDKVVMLENRGDIPALMSLMDVFLFPSIYEGLPVVLVEAQAMGLKCIVSENITQSVHVTENYMSLSLDADVLVWCDAILNNDIYTEPVGKLEDFDMKEIVKQLENMYFSE